MVYALVNHVANVSGTSNGFTSDSIDSSGSDLLIVGLSQGNSVVTGSISDNKGNLWTQLTRVLSTGKSSEIWYAWNAIVGTGHTFTVTGTADFPAICVAGFSGSQTSSDPFDVENGNSAVFNSNLQTGSITPSTDNELLIAYFQSDGQTTQATINLGFTVLDSTTDANFGHQSASMAYLIETTALARNPNWNRPDGNSTLTANIAAFTSAPSTPDLPGLPAFQLNNAFSISMARRS